MSTVAPPRRTSRADAARWVARRIQDGTDPDQIVRELRQDGLAQPTAQELYHEVLASYRRTMRPSGRVLERVVSMGVLVALGGAVLWVAAAPGAADVPVVTMGMTAQMAVGVVVGIASAVALGYAAGGRRAPLIVAIAVAADLFAVVVGHGLAAGSDAADPVLVGISAAFACGASIFCLTRWRGRFELVAGESGSFEWRRTKGIATSRIRRT